MKKAIERKEEMGDYIREFSVSQFNKNHSTPQVLVHVIGPLQLAITWLDSAMLESKLCCIG